MKQIIISIRCLVVLTIICGVIYPLGITLVAKVFPNQATGSLVSQNGVVVGSSLLAQKFTSPKYFWPRPSSADYATVASGASNLGPTSEALKKLVDERRGNGASTPDALTASASSLDPHISPENARSQMARIAASRHLTDEQRRSLERTVDSHVEGPQLGFLGEPRVNVLLLNMEVDRLFP